MKNAIKIICGVSIIILFAFTTHKPYVGNWAGLASNQWISYEDVQNGISTGALTAKSGGTDPALSATKWITKDQFEGWVQTTSVSGSGNQWITKSMVSAINLYNVPLKGYNGSGSGYSTNGFTSSGDALIYGPTGSDNPNMWWTSTTLSVGMDLYLYTNPNYSYAIYSLYDNLWWYNPSSGCAVQLHGVNTSGSYVGNPMRISAITCPTPVYIGVTVVFNTYGSATATVTAYSDASHTTLINVDTDVTVSYQFTDDLSGTYTDNAIISAGTSSKNKTKSINPSAISVDGPMVTGVSPTSSSTQIYNY